MKKYLNTYTFYALMVVCALAAMLAGLQSANRADAQSSRAIAYDSTETVTKNMVDAMIAIANANVPFLNDVLFVDGDRTDDYTADGSMAAPYKTIAAAKTASVSGDVIIVAPGAYAETVTLTAGTSLFGWEVTGTTLTGDYVIFDAGGVTLTGAVSAADVTATDDLVVGGWPSFASTTISTQSYTISSTGKAAGYISEYSDDGASTIFLPDVPADGTLIWIKDGDNNAGSNNVVIATEGSDTIDEAASVTFDANGDATFFYYDAGNTDWVTLSDF